MAARGTRTWDSMPVCPSAASHSIFKERGTMTRHLFHWTMLGLVGLMTTTTVGCTRWIDVIPSTTSRLESVTQTILNNERVPLVMDGFRMTQNGRSEEHTSELQS